MANKEATLLLKIKSAGEDILERIGSKIPSLATLAVAAFAAISAVVVKSIADYREQEEATNALSRAMVNQGMYTKALKDEYLENAAALQKVSLFGDEQIVKAQGILQGYLGQTKVTKELTQATLDLAQAKGMDLASAAEAVGKSIGTSTNALARNGVEVNANASKQEKLHQVLTGINSQWGGQAEAATNGLGALKQVENVISDLFETIGERLTPVIVLFANSLKGLNSDTSIMVPIIDTFIDTLQLLTNVGVVVETVIEAIAKAVGGVLMGAFESVAAVIEGDFTKAFQAIKTRGAEAFESLTSADIVGRVSAVNEAFTKSTEENLAEQEKLEKESAARKSDAALAAQTELAIKKQEQAIAQQQIDMQLIGANEEEKAKAELDAKIKHQENILKLATDSQSKLGALNEIYRLNELKKEQIANDTQAKNRKDTLNTIAGLQSSHNSTLAAIGKAAAITQIAIETPVAIAKALSAFPPPFNFAAAGLVGAAMAAQAANIAGVQLADGGIVMPRPGGVQATIAEAGQAEAVIPLDRADEFGLGGGGGANVTIKVYGGLLGSESEAREFAVAVDRELLKLRQNNESVAFDSGVI